MAVPVSAGRVSGSVAVRLDVAVSVGVALAVAVRAGKAVPVAVGTSVNVGGRVGAGSPGARNVAQASMVITRSKTHRPRVRAGDRRREFVFMIRLSAGRLRRRWAGARSWPECGQAV